VVVVGVVVRDDVADVVAVVVSVVDTLVVGEVVAVVVSVVVRVVSMRAVGPAAHVPDTAPISVTSLPRLPLTMHSEAAKVKATHRGCAVHNSAQSAGPLTICGTSRFVPVSSTPCKFAEQVFGETTPSDRTVVG